MATMYGHEVGPNDHFVSIAEQAADKINPSTFTGCTPVNVFPILRYVPSWFPGAQFKREALEVQVLTKQIRNIPFDFAKENMVNSEFLGRLS